MMQAPTGSPRRGAARAAFAVLALLLAGAAHPALAEEFILNGTFDSDSAPWWGAGVTLAVVNGQLCATVPPGTVNPWDAIIGQNGVSLEQGKTYTLSFSATADVPVSVKALVQLTDSPYTSTLAESTPLGSSLAAYTYSFTNVLPTGALGVQFQMGGNAAGFTACFDDLSLSDGGKGYVPDTGPALRVNQLGYVPNGPKRADLITDATTPQPWELVDAAGKVVATGVTSVHGADAESGDSVQIVDFSRFHRPGTGYTLRVGDVVSYPFAISPALYDGLRYDAVEFFYHQRSGVAIDAQLVGAAYARPAGHVGVAPNQGDTLVPCLDGVCTYSLDVRGGWYDAGDQGKYVVNGGIATWQLLDTWERATPRGRMALRDGTQRIPERGNRVPDILDEARWELEFLLRMQIPEGQPYAGMAQHKVHDDAWTGIPTRPDQDAQPRHLRGPSTAATLNLAATAAQCARVWRDLDRAFARRCLVAAERAWAAAVANPAVFCTPGGGGGDYGDQNLEDERYWAAAELFVTTGKRAYEDAVRTSPLFLAKGIPATGFDWADVSALGDFTLARVPNRLPPRDQQALRKALVALADARIATMKSQGYPVPYLPTDGKYSWGSNSQVLNQISVLAVAHEVTGDPKYRQAAFEAMDYVLGRNGLNQSYVTGYGSKSSQNEHHRFFSHQANAAYPNPPAGSLAGGPNSFLQDPVAQSKLQGCAAHKCYIDHIESYSTNEVAINWNSALAWVSAWLADHSE